MAVLIGRRAEARSTTPDADRTNRRVNNSLSY